GRGNRVATGGEEALQDGQAGRVRGRNGRDIVLGTIEQLLRSELRVGRNAVDRLDRVFDFSLVSSQLVGIVEAFVGGMNGQFAHRDQQRVDFVQRALGGLNHVDRTFRVLNGARQTGDLGTELFRNDQTG